MSSFVQSAHRFGQAVIVGVADTADRRGNPNPSQALTVPNGLVLREFKGSLQRYSWYERTQREARRAVFAWIEGWYNPHRRHSWLGHFESVRR